MTIRYSNGNSQEAVLLARTPDTLRVAIQGTDDVVELTCRNGVWVTDDCEPVQVEFAWAKRGRTQEVTEQDCICPAELASKLIHLLYSGENDETKPNQRPLTAAAGGAFVHPVI